MSTFVTDEQGTYITKDPSSNLDYSHDWTDWLIGVDTIVNSTWAATTGVTLTFPTIVGDITSVFISGGTLNETYEVINTVTCSSGRIDQRSFFLLIKDN